VSEKVELVLALSVLFSILLSIVATSSKTGYIYGNVKQDLTKKPPKFFVDKSKKSKFAMYCVMIACLLFAGAWLLTKDAMLSTGVALFDTAFIGYALAYFVLLKEKPKTKKTSKK
jgi:hypothetical protein